MKFCNQCGHAVSKKIPIDDDRLRHVCDVCEHIHYQNPRVIVGVLPTFQRQVLLCKRAIAPRHGYWTLPAGFLENGETTAEGAHRETWEEARAKVERSDLYCIFDLPYINQIYMFYLAELNEPQFAAGPESLEVQLFDEADIPWENLAFPVVNSALKHYFSDRVNDHFPTRNEAMLFRPPKGKAPA